MLSLQNAGLSIYRFFSSNLFFYVSVLIFSAGVIWIATTSLYPMAFDEEFHWGLIQIFATSLLPYGIDHTRDMAQYGVATADPSYLFHYLLSWPYRLLNLAGLPDIAIIIMLRVVNLTLIIGSLFIFKHAFKKANIPNIVSNASLAIFMFIPTFAMLAAQINYDSLLMLVVAICLLLVVTITNQVLKTGILPAKETWLLALTVLIGMPVKYAFLPIAAGFFIWMLILISIARQKFNQSIAHQIQSFLSASKKFTTKTKLLLSVFAIAGLFFAAHYVTNFIQYGSAIPKCDAVFDREACKSYGPWNRNQGYIQNLSPSFTPVSFPIYITEYWLPGMTQRLTFAVAGKTNDFQTKMPLTLVNNGFVVLALVGAGFTSWRFLRYRNTITPFVYITLVLTLVYCGVLAVQLYGSYVKTGVPVALNGRYLLLLLPIVGVVMIESAAIGLARISRNLKTLFLIFVLLFFSITGAGWATYIIQSEPHWFWTGWGQSSQAILQPAFDTLTFQLKDYTD